MRVCVEDYAIDYTYVVANTRHGDRWDKYSLERENSVHGFGYRRAIHKCIRCSPRPRPPRRSKAIHYFPLLEGNFVESSSSSPMTLGSNAVLSSSWVRMKRRVVPLQVTPRPLSGQVLGCRGTAHVWRGALRAQAHGLQRRRLVVWCAFHFPAIRPGFLSHVPAG